MGPCLCNHVIAPDLHTEPSRAGLCRFGDLGKILDGALYKYFKSAFEKKEYVIIDCYIIISKIYKAADGETQAIVREYKLHLSNVRQQSGAALG